MKRGRAIDLCRIFTRKCAAAVTAHAAVGIDDDLAAGEAGVPVGSADDETASGIDVVFGFAVHHVGGDDGIDDVLANVFAELFGGDIFAVLRGDDNGVDADGLVVHVFHGNLALAIGAEIGKLARFADGGEAFGDTVRQLDGQRHQFRSLIAGVAEHQTLIAGAAGINTHRDIGRLALDGVEDATGFGIEAECGVGVADVSDDLARDGWDIDVAGGGDFARDDADAGGDEHLTGDATHGVLREDRIENAVGDLVGDFIGVAFGHRFGCKKMFLGFCHAAPFY